MTKRVLFLLTGLYQNGAVLSTLTTIRYLDRTKYTPELFVLESGEAWPELLEGTAVTYGLRPWRVGQNGVRRWFWRGSGTFYGRADILVGGPRDDPDLSSRNAR